MATTTSWHGAVLTCCKQEFKLFYSDIRQVIEKLFSSEELKDDLVYQAFQDLDEFGKEMFTVLSGGLYELFLTFPLPPLSGNPEWPKPPCFQFSSFTTNLTGSQTSVGVSAWRSDGFQLCKLCGHEAMASCTVSVDGVDVVLHPNCPGAVCIGFTWWCIPVAVLKRWSSMTYSFVEDSHPKFCLLV
ncbi:hypothetical protein BT69DRAFT_1296623 [Atractiella rhizophila]|nr:hypothetical protein BT69DRAFT_1296623 [Atractiella rhizophila]